MEIYSKEIIEMYKNGFSGLKISKKYNVSVSYVYNVLKRNNVEIRSNKENSLKYTFDKNYFDVIDTENKAYWLGFIYADGYLTQNCLGISLGEIDLNHLYKFKNDISSTHNIKIYKINSIWSNKNYCRILIRNDHLVDTLESNGVFRNKTNRILPPNKDILPKDLYRHFIRGYFDGNGSIKKSYISYNTQKYSSSLVSTPEFIEWVKDVIFENTGIDKFNISKRHDYDYVISIEYSVVPSIPVLDFLYRDSKIYLDRKYERYIEVMKYANSQQYQK